MAINKVALEFGAWEPDAAILNGTQAPEAKNCIPAKRGYMALNGIARMQFDALPKAVLSGYAMKEGDVMHTYVATKDSIYALENREWVEKYTGTAVSDGRPFMRYGADIYALFGRELLRGQTSGGVTSDFEAVADAPGGEVLGVIRDFLVIGRLTGYENGIHWSAIDNPTNWPAIGTDDAQFVQSDRQIFPVGGKVQAIVGGVGGVDGLIFLEDAIQRATYVGTPYIFQFDHVDRERGLLAPNSPVVCGNTCLYLSEDGWRITDGSSVKGIGVERVDRWFFDNCDQARVVEIRGVHDAQHRLAIWTFPSNTAPAGVHDRILIYSYTMDKWSYGEVTTEAMFTDYTRGLSLEDLDAFGTISDLPFSSLDSSALKNGRLGVFLVDTEHYMASLSGPSLEAVIDTSEQGGERMMLHGLRPLVDGGGAEAMPLYRSREMDDRHGGKYTKQQRDGVCYQHLSTVYLAARVKVPAGLTWRHAVGVEALVEMEGGM